MAGRLGETKIGDAKAAGIETALNVELDLGKGCRAIDQTELTGIAPRLSFGLIG